ncbi:hypothetical protein D3C86_1766020 [compost metagenome]
MVLSRWAMITRVIFNRSRLAVTIAWVRLSSALVASSKMTIFGLRAIARAISKR